MLFITSIEPRGRAERRRQTLRDNIRAVLETRFDTVPCGLRETIQGVATRRP